MNGRSERVPKKNRKKATCMGCMEVPIYLAIVSFKLLTIKLRINHAIPIM
jgi:hypothetical protein